MLSSLVGFEWRYHTRQASFLAAILFFVGWGFLLTATGFGPANLDVNAPFLVMQTLGFVSIFSVFAVAIFGSNAVLRDGEHRMEEIVFTTPVGKFQYLIGRLSGAFLAALTTASVAAIGMIVATRMPWQNAERVAPIELSSYLWALVVLVVPNVLFATVLLFAIAVATRSALATYVGAVFIYVMYFVGAALTNSPLMAASVAGGGGGVLPALLDPFGLSSFFHDTRYW
ncbi:MAG: ABC transporter permease, partial [Thermoanaerobaculia bacterium]